MFHEMPPTGFIRILDDGVPVCDVSQEQANYLYRSDGIIWDDDHYVLTEAGRAYIKARLLN